VRIITRKYLLLYLTLLVVFAIVNFLSTDSDRKVFIDGDGSGHYAYLPAIFIFHSVDFDEVLQFEKQKRPPDYMGHYFHKHGDVHINKYTIGTALLQLPFFLLGFLISLLLGLTPDGYNIIFQYSVAFATLFWVGQGIIYFVKLLLTYGIDRKFAWAMATVTLFGTNLFFYVFVQPSFSHTYSFTLITIFLYFCRKGFLNYEKRYMLLASFLMGLVILVRPINIVIVASLPFIAGTPQLFFNTVKLKFKGYDYIPAVIILALTISPQLIINYLQTGGLIIFGYKNEGFYFTEPQISNFLFSYRKGWFIYSPVFLLLLPAVIYQGWRKSIYAAISFVIFFFILVYIFSSWWNWFYGDSFGMRPMVDYYGLFMLVIALFLFQIKMKWFRIIAAFFISIFLLLNLFQSYQYAVGIIHPDSMSKRSYWHVFLKMDKKFKNVISGSDESYYGRLSKKPFFSSSNHIDNFDQGWTTSNSLNREISFSDSLSVIQTPINIYSPSLKFQISDTLIGYNNIFVRFKSYYYELEQNASLKALFVVDINDTNGSSVFYKAFRVKQLPDNINQSWQEGSIGFKLPEITENMAYIKFYIWNVKKQTYLLDDLTIQLSTYSPDN